MVHEFLKGEIPFEEFDGVGGVEFESLGGLGAHWLVAVTSRLSVGGVLRYGEWRRRKIRLTSKTYGIIHLRIRLYYIVPLPKWRMLPGVFSSGERSW